MANADDAHTEPAPLAHVEFGPPPSGDDAERWFEGRSPAIVRFRSLLDRAAQDAAGVLVLLGEHGTGKRRAATWLHRVSRRGKAPLVFVDATSDDAAPMLAGIAAAIRDAGPSATGDRIPGHVVLCDAHAAKPQVADAAIELLLAQGVALRCGLVVTAHPATDPRSQSEAVARLLARSGTSTLQVPPLRERIDDVPLLARALVQKWARILRRDVRGLSPQAQDALLRHAFPGNVKELSELIHLAILHTQSAWLTIDAFPHLGGALRTSTEPGELVIRLPGASLRDIELETLRMALSLTGGRVVRAAEMLGITRHALRRKLEKYDLTGLRHRARSRAPDAEPGGPEDDNYI
ncbi:MAG: sigma-54-dependent Fis family transcriptional regulator [Deltaproteobacteria bacterium]|nr:MAG: sigma-54-dependent Fis family transcriptional regulator [Deltaproteobacteria bacterium]